MARKTLPTLSGSLRRYSRSTTGSPWRLPRTVSSSGGPACRRGRWHINPPGGYLTLFIPSMKKIMSMTLATGYLNVVESCPKSKARVEIRESSIISLLAS